MPRKEGSTKGIPLSVECGGLIRSFRENYGLSQPVLANCVNVTKATIYRVENGIITSLSKPTIENLAYVIDEDPRRLVSKRWIQERIDFLEGRIKNDTDELARLKEELPSFSD